MSIFRIRFSIAGGHVHCALFVAKNSNLTFAKCGDFVVSKGEEFRTLTQNFRNAELIGRDENVGIMEACSDE